MIKKARKPFVFVGGGSIISGASAEIAEFVEKVDAPVCDTLMGKGAFDGTNERYTGMLGMHGTKTSNFGVMECDLLIVLGARFSDRVTGDTSKFASNARILQIDIDPAEINKNIKVDMSIVGDIKVVLEAINARLDKENHKEWMNHIYEMKKEYPLRYNKDILTGPYLMEKILKLQTVMQLLQQRSDNIRCGPPNIINTKSLELSFHQEALAQWATDLVHLSVPS